MKNFKYPVLVIFESKYGNDYSVATSKDALSDILIEEFISRYKEGIYESYEYLSNELEQNKSKFTDLEQNKDKYIKNFNTAFFDREYHNTKWYIENLARDLKYASKRKELYEACELLSDRKDLGVAAYNILLQRSEYEYEKIEFIQNVKIK